MEPPKNKKKHYRFRTIGVGVILIICGLVNICTGHISMGNRWQPKVTFSLAENPLMFWVSVSLTFVLAAICLLWGFADRK